MFEKIYLHKNACSHFYILMIAAFKIIHLLILGTFIYFLWEQRYSYIELFEQQRMIKAHDTKDWKEYTDLLYLVGIETIYLLIKLFIINLIIKIFKNIKIPNIWIKKWDDDGYIDNIFGRYLCEHIRYYKKINFEDFYSLNKFCNEQNKNLNKISKDNNLVQLFNKYDENYISDKKNIN